MHESATRIGQAGGGQAAKATFAEFLRRMPGYSQQIVYAVEQPARPASLGEPAEPLAPALRERLAAVGIGALYKHQAQAVDAARRGENVCVVTATASGKSLCYILPILDMLCREPEGRALLLFPTKALLHDQRAALQRLVGDLPISIAVYDGDTPPGEVGKVRQARIVLSNPDKVHMGLIPYARNGWAPFVRNLRFVVVDEAHSYSGIFGGHVALVLRRLLRACERAASRPRLICCSATIGNPRAHIQALTGAEQLALVEENGAPGGPREIIFWQVPPRRPAEIEALAIFLALIRDGKQTLLFTGNRQSADRLVQQAVDGNPDLRELIASYRAGYLAAERRRIEGAMRDGSLRGLVSTNANELGVDIGALDAVVMAGYPGTVASFWQQAGRAGRSRQAAAAVLVGGTTPLEAYYFANPAALLGSAVEPAHIPIENPNLVRDQLWCAVRDDDLKHADSRWFGGDEALRAALAKLVEDGRLDRRRSGRPGQDGAVRYRYSLRDDTVFPPRMVSLRSIGSVTFTLVDTEGRAIEQGLSLAQVLREAYEGAIYFSQFRIYRVEEVQYADLTVVARELDGDPGYITQANMATAIDERNPSSTQECGAIESSWGSCLVTERVVSYVERPRGRGTPREVPLSMLPRRLETEAVWWDLPGKLLARLAEQGHDELASMNGLAGLLVALLPVFSQSDARDTDEAVYLSDDGREVSGYIAVYDDVEGGCGLTRRGFEQARRWLELAESRLSGCRCASGCPACIHAGPQASRYASIDKAGALLLARLVLGMVAPKAEGKKHTDGVAQPKRRNGLAEGMANGLESALHSTAGAQQPAITLAQVQDRWPQVRGELRARSISRLFELIIAAEPVAVKGSVLTLDFGQDADLARLFAQAENRALLESVFPRVLGHPYRLRCIAAGFDSGHRAAVKQ